MRNPILIALMGLLPLSFGLFSCKGDESPPPPSHTDSIEVIIESSGEVIDGQEPLVNQVHGDSVVEVTFPFKESGTAWKVSWEAVKGHGLVVREAYFKRDLSEDWVKIFHDARIAEIAVPYAHGTDRFFDVGLGFDLVEVHDRDKGPNGTLLGTPPVVVQEIKDRGVIWKDDEAVYRGKEMVLWGTLNASNYNYVIQYSFKDDGTVSFRVAATASNMPGMEEVAHSHTTLWRLDIDLNGPEDDMVYLTRHLEPQGSLSARHEVVSFNQGQEGWMDWNPMEYNTLLIQDTATRNDHGTRIGYNLLPMRLGTPRHYGEGEEFTLHDFWVTKGNHTELIGTSLPRYVNGESIEGTDVVLWYVSPTLHLPRAEDGSYQGDVWEGVALCMWSGFDLRPRNFFSGTPFYSPDMVP